MVSEESCIRLENKMRILVSERPTNSLTLIPVCLDILNTLGELETRAEKQILDQTPPDKYKKPEKSSS